MTPADREIMLRYLVDQLLTEPMSVKELCTYFDRDWRKVKTILQNMPGVEKYDTLYRVPVKKMPLRYLKEQGVFFKQCKIMHNPAIDSDRG